jgi:hypothetical protein
VITGAVVSSTVRVVEHVVELPAASVAVRVTGKTPRPIGVPIVNDWVTVTEPQLSLTEAVLAMSGTRPAQNSLTETVAGGAQLVNTGAVVSLTVKVVVHCAVLPAASVTVIVTVVTPRPTSVFAAGD